MPYPGSRNVLPLDVSAGIFMDTCPLSVGTETSPPSAATGTATGKSAWRSSPLRSKRGCGATVTRR